MLKTSLLDNTDSPSQTNPWSPSSAFVNLGSLQNVISLAEKTGHLQRGTEINEDIKRRASVGSPSIQMITLLRDITKIGHALDKVNRELQKLLRDAETQDVTNLDLLATRAHRLEQLSLHLSAVIDKKDDLIARLQQPFVGEFLEMDSQYHFPASATLPKIASYLATLPDHLDNITWANKFSLKDGQLENVLSSIESSFVDLQNYFRALTKGRKAMEKLQKTLPGKLSL
ncbi:hypothetical protein QZH41_018113 [Actinostola sp. cb2023]|nr:hypothetical protein QZH41_018113 [Actinostola sp. cb2023]